MNSEGKIVAVLGAGTMGSGIATVMAQAGHRTLLFDIDEPNLHRGLATVRGFFDKSVKLGKLESSASEAAKNTISGTTDLLDLASCDVVVEAVYEDLALKKDILARLDTIVSESTLIHTNTSTLSVTGIASGSRLPERVVGTHYCNPAPLMKLVEVADGRHTADWAHKSTIEFLGSLGKTTVVTKDRPGFIVNRFLIPWENACIRALDAGIASKESIDAAVLGSLGHPMGPFRLLDIVGMDIHQQVATRLYEQLRDPKFFPPPMVDRMVAAGDLGRKTGRGFYEYDDTRLFGS
ncbi:3-hydroxybutyryl-CoA dehydrogenase [Rhodococcoides fascians]|uniref:3-hydroxyacyl-CoA dehydrogenase family protein n=1 Tax=Rhodococcoides fascians TaxID=1828 RepID=UPI000B9C1A5A|nr:MULTISPECIES: 3-hydroxyacyl-CoA dehydrogenase family protein [Rhodococcus]OZD68974.1 3-hydroxybutyryl-CoA dehydrogenase [Rhodococcus sp. 06-1059B-a]OZE81344.1 3-hydroxybutyryl-CoA dehydrogenase [Rhodococcus fascians]OZF10168.1 3-hydroxybutyryl-CoA dehydrogenase [Rhodococcus fascians]OZF13259.1 3-hydroxybutyryl-CoA dehydrogenase [Rhodococcus fascians]OZF59356.1 3-hydroxybutyryl-CoA dehydrogenase [Rhodococcus fascians]